jgi:DNA-binding GntR family transcriptional regulator
VSATAQPRRGAATTQEHAVDGLRRAILGGELRPGERVPQEEIADRIGVSVVPLREALRVLEGEGQVTYRPRRGYFVTELNADDLAEIYALRGVLEAQAARAVLPTLDDEAFAALEESARECAAAGAAGDVAAELAANRRFHFGVLTHPEHPHLLRLIRLLWDSTEAYRALYYNSPREREAADDAHRRIIAAARAEDADALVAELNAHRDRALRTLTEVLTP